MYTSNGLSIIELYDMCIYIYVCYTNKLRKKKRNKILYIDYKPVFQYDLNDWNYLQTQTYAIYVVSSTTFKNND